MLKSGATNGARTDGDSSAALPGVARQLEGLAAAWTEPLNGRPVVVQPPGHGEEGFLLMDLSFQTVGVDPGAEAILATDRGGNGRASAFSIPLQVLETIRDARAAELPRLKICLRIGKREYRCRAFLVQLQDGPIRRKLLALHLKAVGEHTDRIGKFSSTYHLTGREEEALRGIAEGLASKELAERMRINPNTVKSFLRLIMLKLGVRRRGEILAKLLNDDARW
jgi:DNA-binding CsgD family transcriptional regulator